VDGWSARGAVHTPPRTARASDPAACFDSVRADPLICARFSAYARRPDIFQVVLEHRRLNHSCRCPPCRAAAPPNPPDRAAALRASRGQGRGRHSRGESRPRWNLPPVPRHGHMPVRHENRSKVRQNWHAPSAKRRAPMDTGATKVPQAIARRDLSHVPLARASRVGGGRAFVGAR
jgi:hypothetical protein